MRSKFSNRNLTLFASVIAICVLAFMAMSREPNNIGVYVSNGAIGNYVTYSSNEEKLLFEAIKDGELAGISRILKAARAENLNATFDSYSCFGGDRGVTVLHAAIHRPEVVQLLLDEGANIEGTSNDNITPLMLAAKKGEIETIKILLNRGANIDGHGNGSALISGINNIDVVDLLLKEGANPNVKRDTRAPLWYASSYPGSVDVVKLLIDHGADTGFKSRKFNESLLHTAALYGHADIAQYLIDKGIDVNSTDNRGYTPLYWSISYDQKEFGISRNGGIEEAKATNNALTQVLLDSGATIDDASKKYFLWSGNTALVKKGLKNVKNVDMPDVYGRSPLHVAVIQGNLELALYLIEKGADVNSRSRKLHIHTPLRYALFKNSQSLSKDVNMLLIELLLKKGADPNIRSSDLNQTSLLHEISRLADYEELYEKSTEVGDLLIKYGADINSRDHRGATPLHRAALAEDRRIISYLVKNGANINAQDNAGRTALITVASAAGTRPDNAKLLLDLGADPNVKTNQGKRAIDFLRDRKIMSEGHYQVIKMLEKQ